MRRYLVPVLGTAAFLLLIALAACTAQAGPAGPAGPKGDAGPAGPAGPSSGSIAGRVLDKLGKPLEKASVGTDPASVTATTDKDGKYTLSNVPIGSYYIVASAAGMNASASKLAVQGGKSTTADFKLSVEEPFPLGAVRSISGSTGDQEVFPNKQTAITLNAGYGTSNNNLIITSGLNNVPVGTFVYLQGRDADASGAKITAWAWTVTGPREKQVTVENGSTQLPRFMADEEGRYEVTITATNDKTAKESSSFEVYAGHYVGASNCITCHSGSVMPDTVTSFKETGHADKFQATYASYSAKSDYCIRCHTTGYDETSKAGGFAAAAKQAGWDPTKGSVAGWLKASNLTVDQVMNTPMGDFANITCENCHGPGSVHTKALSYEPGVCSQCHAQELQWRNSGHALTGYKNLHTAEGTSCVQCHTGQGFVTVTIRGEQAVFPNMERDGLKANLPDPGAMAEIACATCHDPHAATEPEKNASGATFSKQLRLVGNITMPNGQTVDAKDSASCVSCHADKRDLTYKADYLAGKNTRGAHDDTQADVFYGVTASVFDFGGSPYATSPHAAVVSEACVACHMAANPAAPQGAQADNVQVLSSHGALSLITVGGHSWNMSGPYKDTNVQNVAACTSCHKELTSFNRKANGDYDGDGKVEGIQDEVDGLLKLVEAQLPKDSKGAVVSSITKDNTTEIQRQALWNYAVVKNDGSRGVHNTAFSVQVLQRTYKALAGKDVPGATLR